jgi:ubiquinone/menaquinone biosynthesis C-methylase UbiE
MSLHVLQRFSLSRRLFLKLTAPRAHETVRHFAACLQPRETILDVGSGIGDVTQLLMKEGYQVTALDVKNISFIPTIKPVIYDGRVMPFADKSFDTALILTVLHHAHNPETVLLEAARVARRVIIIEDVYSSKPHKYATFFMDSLLNLEFIGHPHTNQTDQSWQQTFRDIGLELMDTKVMKSWVVLRHKMYILEPK